MFVHDFSFNNSASDTKFSQHLTNKLALNQGFYSNKEFGNLSYLTGCENAPQLWGTTCLT